MIFRTATVTDIPQMHRVRNAVKENQLSNPDLITEADYQAFMTTRGKGWVCAVSGTIVGFAVADLEDNNIWALFVDPDYERQGIGRRLHDLMLDWYFEQGKEGVWLGTAPNTRAATFYRRSGWTATGKHGQGEIKFEMSRSAWSDWKKARQTDR